MSDWTSDRVAKLKELNAEGLSAAQIARALGDTTRCAVIGKLSRLGLFLRGGGHVHQRPRHVPVAAREPKRIAAEMTDPEPESLHIAIINAREGMCRWPHGSPQHLETFHFCGHLTNIPNVYCDYHMRRAAGSTTAGYVARWNLPGVKGLRAP